jgi:hypothetical protein
MRMAQVYLLRQSGRPQSLVLLSFSTSLVLFGFAGGSASPSHACDHALVATCGDRLHMRRHGATFGDRLQHAATECAVRRGRYKVAHLRRLKALWDEKESLDRQRVRRRRTARPRIQTRGRWQHGPAGAGPRSLARLHAGRRGNCARAATLSPELNPKPYMN